MAGTFDAKEKQEKVDAFEGSKKVPPPAVLQTLLDKCKKNFKKGGGNLTDHPGHA